MKRLHLTLLALTALAFSLATSAQAQTTAKEHEVIKLEREMTSGLRNGDVSAVERYTSDDYTITNASGQLVVSQVYAAAQGENEARQLAQLKQQVAKRVADKKTNVKIKLRDGTEVKGQIQQVAAENFVVLNKATGGETTIAYQEVAKMRGQGLSKGAKIAITAATVVGAAFIVFAIIVRARLG